MNLKIIKYIILIVFLMGYYFIKPKNEILSLLASIGKQLKDYECFTHFEIFSDSLDKPIYATINLKSQEVSYVSI